MIHFTTVVDLLSLCIRSLQIRQVNSGSATIKATMKLGPHLRRHRHQLHRLQHLSRIICTVNHNQPMITRHQAGFSLLELLIACNLLGLMLAIGWPSMQEMLARQQAQSYLRQFQQHLNFARIIAISSGRVVTVCPKHGNDCLNQWWQIPVQINQHQTNKQLTLLRQLERPNDMHWLYYNRDQIQFRQDGSLQALQNGTFVYCAKQYSWHYTLSLSQAGRSQSEFVAAPCPH
jgi:type IV fimbrial biogenesis protein FimT